MTTTFPEYQIKNEVYGKQEAEKKLTLYPS